MQQHWNDPVKKARDLQLKTMSKNPEFSDEQRILADLNYQKHKEIVEGIEQLVGIKVQNNTIIINTPLVNPMMKIGDSEKLMIKPQSSIEDEIRIYRKSLHKVLAIGDNLTKQFGIESGDYVYLQPSENGFDIKIGDIPFLGYQWHQVVYFIPKKQKETVERYFDDKIKSFNDRIQRSGTQVLSEG